MFNYKWFYSESLVNCDLANWSKLNNDYTEPREQIIPKSEERRVKLLATELIASGKSVAKTSFATEPEMIDETARLSSKSEVIVNARAGFENLVAKVHLLVKNADGSYTLVDTKCATSPKQKHYDEMTFAYYVFTNAGYNISKIELLYIDSEYYLNGEIEAHKIFKRVNPLPKIIKSVEELPERIAKFRSRLSRLDLFSMQKVGIYCRSCPYNYKCLPSENVFDFLGNDELKEAIATDADLSIKESHREKIISATKLIELNSLFDKQTYVNTEELNKFLSALEYPLYFFDYECFQPIIPAFQKSTTYQHIPFQYSLHIQESPDAELKHISFIHDSRTDPRENVAKRLVRDFSELIASGKGSVLVYYQQYELSRNDELAKMFPEYRDAINKISAKVVDLYEIFKNRHIYSYKQKNSASIKNVLPAFSDFSYKNLNISNGLLAANSYFGYLEGRIELETIYDDLEKYCFQDTLAMYILLELVRKLVK